MNPEDFFEKWEAQSAMKRDLLAIIEDTRKRTIVSCAEVAENGNFLHDDAPDARFGKACGAAIRRLI